MVFKNYIFKLQLRRAQGKTGKIIDTVPLKDFLKGETDKENQPVSSSTLIQRQKKVTRRAVVPKDLRQQLQQSPCKSNGLLVVFIFTDLICSDYRQPLTPQKPSRKTDKNYHEVYSSSDSLDIDDILATPLKSEEEFNFQSPGRPFSYFLSYRFLEPFRIRTNRGNRAQSEKEPRLHSDFGETPNSVQITRRTKTAPKDPSDRYSSPAGKS